MPVCNSGPYTKIREDSFELFTEMNSLWISYTGKDNTKFWGHEYNTHGYCYMMKYKLVDPKAYFKASLDIFIKYNLDQVVRKAFGDLVGEKYFQFK